MVCVCCFALLVCLETNCCIYQFKEPTMMERRLQVFAHGLGKLPTWYVNLYPVSPGVPRRCYPHVMYVRTYLVRP
ncbi:hypothetical protein F4818DRAFT_22243 [Hypoxylon cercidicola]|nr:hypothetical protein F4818DRAFT_22243 [Hypoxylon cercidicola]